MAVSEVALVAHFATMSPDGKRFAFLGIPQEPPGSGFGIYVAGFHDKESRKIVDVGLPRQRTYMDVTTNTMLDWAADSENLLFSNEQTVSLVNAQTGTVRKLADGGGAQGSPSSDWISYITVKLQAGLLNLKTGETKLIDHGHEVLREMEWSPDGKYLLIFEGEGSHVPYGCLWVYRVSDGAFVPIPYYGTAGPAPHWIRLGKL